MAQELMRHPPTTLNDPMVAAIAEAVRACVAATEWSIAAAAIEPTHMHLLITYTARDIDNTAKWISQKTTKAVHQSTPFNGPVWCEGKWLGFVFDSDHWANLRQYIKRHNLRHGLPAQPWPWITPHKAGHGMPGLRATDRRFHRQR
jgi:REP element-mobilizing transposase RayT